MKWARPAACLPFSSSPPEYSDGPSRRRQVTRQTQTQRGGPKVRVLPPIHVHTPHTNLSPRVFIYLGRLLSRSGVGLKCLRYFRFSAIITEMSKKPGVMYARTDAAASSQSPVGAPSWRGPVTSRHVATNRANRARDLLTMCVSVVAGSVRPSGSGRGFATGYGRNGLSAVRSSASIC